MVSHRETATQCFEPDSALCAERLLSETQPNTKETRQAIGQYYYIKARADGNLRHFTWFPTGKQ